MLAQTGTQLPNPESLPTSDRRPIRQLAGIGHLPGFRIIFEAADLFQHIYIMCLLFYILFLTEEYLHVIFDLVGLEQGNSGYLRHDFPALCQPQQLVQGQFLPDAGDLFFQGALIAVHLDGGKDLLYEVIDIELLFFGAWLSPIPFLPDGWWWMVGKMWFFFFLFAMVKAIVPRYRYDQLMRIGWKVFLPLSIGWVVIVSFLAKFEVLGGFWARWAMGG